jgi:hypothetical protein
MQLQILQRLLHAFPPSEVRAPALDEQVGKEQQEARHDRQRLP